MSDTKTIWQVDKTLGIISNEFRLQPVTEMTVKLGKELLRKD